MREALSGYNIKTQSQIIDQLFSAAAFQDDKLCREEDLA